MLGYIGFFRRFTNNIYIDFDRINTILKEYPKGIKKVIEFLEPYSENKASIITRDYFNKYFSFRQDFGCTYIFDLAKFLEFAIVEFDNFIEDMEDAVI